MSHNTDTQSRPIPMPRQSGLLDRDGYFYLNMRVPKELSSLYGKCQIVRRSLHTTIRREAVRALRREMALVEEEFDDKRRDLREAKQREAQNPLALEISDEEARRLVYRWFIGLEKLAQDWWENDGIKFSDEQLAETVDSLRIDMTALSGGNCNYESDDGTRNLDGFLKKEGIDIPKSSAAYRKLRPLFRMARMENTKRVIDRATHNSVVAREPLFREVFAHTPPPNNRKNVKLGEMLDRYSAWMVEADRSQGTHRTYQLPARLLREVLGEKTLVAEIAKEDIERLFGLLRRAPAHATQKYPGLTLEKAIAAAEKAGDHRVLGRKTLENYYTNIVAIFNYAVAKEHISANPAKDKYLRTLFERKEEVKPKTLFAIEELNQMFRAPLYIGCRDDGSGFNIPGKSRPRKGRFWVPLLSLFQGFRCNEAVQLYTEDVWEEKGVPYFEIREERADETKCDKRLKTKQSKRRVPIHPELIKCGFLDFVAKRRQDMDHPRLFPDLPCGATGYFSDPFSKWFARFRAMTLGAKCKASFHSFRHHFRQALGEAGVSIPDVERLGGWELMERSSEKGYGGAGLPYLLEQIAKVKYPGLDLSHLQPVSIMHPVRIRFGERLLRQPIRFAKGA